MKYKYFDKYEVRIIEYLDAVRTPASTRDIANQVGIHWNTSKKGLENLEKKKVVIKTIMGNKTLWKIKKP